MIAHTETLRYASADLTVAMAIALNKVNPASSRGPQQPVTLVKLADYYDATQNVTNEKGQYVTTLRNRDTIPGNMPTTTAPNVFQICINQLL